MSKAFYILIWIGLVACKSEQKAPAKMIEAEKAKTILEYNKNLVNSTYEFMKSYADSSTTNFVETGSGLFISTFNKAVKRRANAEDKVFVEYQSTVLQNAYTFISNETGTVKSLKLKGIIEAVQLLSEGDSATLLVPPHLAYGIRGDGNNIPPAAVLKVDLHLRKIY